MRRRTGKKKVFFLLQTDITIKKKKIIFIILIVSFYNRFPFSLTARMDLAGQMTRRLLLAGRSTV
jgi:hypothetical protein